MYYNMVSSSVATAAVLPWSDIMAASPKALKEEGRRIY